MEHKSSAAIILGAPYYCKSFGRGSPTTGSCHPTHKQSLSTPAIHLVGLLCDLLPIHLPFTRGYSYVIPRLSLYLRRCCRVGRLGPLKLMNHRDEALSRLRKARRVEHHHTQMRIMVTADATKMRNFLSSLFPALSQCRISKIFPKTAVRPHPFPLFDAVPMPTKISHPVNAR